MCDYEEEPLPCAHCWGTGQVWLDDITCEECDYCCGTGVGRVTAEWFDQYREKAQGNHRYHCLGCGRFVPTATVQAGWGRYEPYEWEANGTCGSCGRVEVHWGPM